MAKDQKNCVVVNTHWFGGDSANLPPDTKYIGRPGIWGNGYSSKSGKFTKEECIAFHRVEMYTKLVANPSWLEEIRRELGGHDLACWCKQVKRVVGCHGDTYLHLLSDHCATRDYSRSVIFYLMDDLRFVLGRLQDKVTHQVPEDEFLFLDVHLGDVRIYVTQLVRFLKEKNIGFDSMANVLAKVIVDLELAFADTNKDLVEYRFNHVQWICDQFMAGTQDRSREPHPPAFPKKG